MSLNDLYVRAIDALARAATAALAPALAWWVASTSKDNEILKAEREALETEHAKDIEFARDLNDPSARERMRDRLRKAGDAGDDA